MDRNEIVKTLFSLDERCLRIALLSILRKIENFSSCSKNDFLESLEIAKSYKESNQ